MMTLKETIEKLDTALDRLINRLNGKINKVRADLAGRQLSSLKSGQIVSDKPRFPRGRLWVEDLVYPPISSLAVILTQKCNLKCVYCLRNANSKSDDDPEIPFDRLEQIVLSCHRAGCRGTGLTGGEFFLYSNWRKLVSLLGTLRWDSLIETNGILINANPHYVDYLVENLGNRFGLLVSLDSFQEDKHDLHRGRGSFRQALGAIKMIKSKNVKLEVNAILTPANLMSEQDLRRYLDFVKELGADVVHIGRVVPQGRGEDQRLLLSVRQINRISELSKKYNDGSIQWGFFNNMDERSGCPRIGRNICVSPFGIHPCIFHQDIKIGNLGDFDGIIWSDFMQSLDMLRRAARTGFARPIYNCGDCVSVLGLYLKEVQKVEIITY